MIERLHAAVAAVAPIYGVSGRQGAIRVDFKPEATAAQKTAAQGVVAAFDWSQAAHDAWIEDQQPERKTLRQQAQAAIDDLQAYAAVNNPTNAQTVAIVKRICQVLVFVIRRLIQI